MQFTLRIERIHIERYTISIDGKLMGRSFNTKKQALLYAAGYTNALTAHTAHSVIVILPDDSGRIQDS